MTRLRDLFFLFGLILAGAVPGFGQEVSDVAKVPDESVEASKSGTDESAESQESNTESKTGYEEPPAIGGVTSVGMQMLEDDAIKLPLINFNVLHENFYKWKKRLRSKTGVEFNVDYIFLNQYASFSADDRRGGAGALRFYGRWYPLWAKGPGKGGLFFRFENRHQIGPQTPKELGLATGSSLTTASFKEFGWGTTALYWTQKTDDGRLALAIGQMDPGDFEDIFPLLTAWTAFTNNASFNNPTTALPDQGLGVVGRAFVSDHIYLKAGLNDANGKPTKIDFDSFFDVREYFTWGEVGWAPDPDRELGGESVHLLVWHSDERVEAEVPEGWGLAFSASMEIDETWIPYIRAGYSEGNAASLRAMVSLGAGWRVREDDLFGAAVTWGSPPESENGRDQYTIETFYRLQLTHNLEVTPGFHWHIKPTYNPLKDSVWVAAVLRVRFVL